MDGRKITVIIQVKGLIVKCSGKCKFHELSEPLSSIKKANRKDYCWVADGVTTCLPLLWIDIDIDFDSR
jgi:hypothetical protein